MNAENANTTLTMYLRGQPWYDALDGDTQSVINLSLASFTRAKARIAATYMRNQCVKELLEAHPLGVEAVRDQIEKIDPALIEPPI